jgi:microcystin-dependent protein
MEFDGWLLCNGQTIPSGTKYTALRNLLGSTYGSGKVPNFQGYFLRGYGGNSAAVGTAQADSAPNITGQAYVLHNGYSHVLDGASGAFFLDGSSNNNGMVVAKDGSGTRPYFKLDASRSSASYGRRSEVAPANYAVYYYIKY